MSATQETTRQPRQLKTEAPPTGASNGNGATASLSFNTIEINDTDISVPVKFIAGHTLTENEAKVIQAAYERQFTNNQNALAKARSEGKNTTPQPDAAALAALFAGYEPSVGGTPRQSAMEKMRNDAARRFWVVYVAEHNASISKGGAPIIVKAGNKPVQLFSGKGSAEKWEALCAGLLSLPQYAASIQVHLDAILAERGTKKPEVAADAVSVSSTDLL